MANLRLLVFVLLSLQYAYGLNIVVTNFTQCEKPMTTVKLSFKMGNTGPQLCSIDYNSPVENGDNFRLEFVVRLLRGKHWQKVINVKEEKGLCKALHMYLKGMTDKALDMAGQPKECPLREGTIRVKDLPLDFTKFQVLPIPKGKLSLIGKSYEKSTGKLGICVYFEADSI